jgi:hypothetical protein
LAANQDRIVRGMRIIRRGLSAGIQQWCVLGPGGTDDRAAG